jgi:hypothetical protein
MNSPSRSRVDTKHIWEMSPNIEGIVVHLGVGVSIDVYHINYLE